jgi:hypothetical protein
MMTFLKKLGAVAGLAAIAACGTKDAASPLSAGPQGRVRFVNLITDPARNPVNVILESVPFGVNLGYTTSTPATLPAPSTAPYAAILAGPRAMVVKRTADTSVTLATLSFTITADQDRTVYATGGTGGAAVTSFETPDDNTLAAAGTVRMRVVNLSAAAGAVDVFVTAAGADLTAATPSVANLAPQSASAYFTVTPGTYVIRTVPAGTAGAARNAAVNLTIAAQTYASGTGRTAVLANSASGAGPAIGFILADR